MASDLVLVCRCPIKRTLGLVGLSEQRLFSVIGTRSGQTLLTNQGSNLELTNLLKASNFLNFSSEYFSLSLMILGSSLHYNTAQVYVT